MVTFQAEIEGGLDMVVIYILYNSSEQNIITDSIVMVV